MKKKIYDIVFAAQYEGLSTKEATDQLLVLFGVVGRSEQLKDFADWLQSDTGNLNHDFRDLVDEYLKSL